MRALEEAVGCRRWEFIDKGRLGDFVSVGEVCVDGCLAATDEVVDVDEMRALGLRTASAGVRDVLVGPFVDPLIVDGFEVDGAEDDSTPVVTVGPFCEGFETVGADEDSVPVVTVGRFLVRVGVLFRAGDLPAGPGVGCFFEGILVRAELGVLLSLFKGVLLEVLWQHRSA